MAVQTDVALKAASTVIKNETLANANSATRVGTLLEDFSDSKASKTEIITVASQITAATVKATPVDADHIGITDSAASNVLKKVTWANIKATLLAYFNTAYATISHTQAASTITSGTFAAGDFVFNGNVEMGGQIHSTVTAKGNSGAGTLTFNWNEGNVQSLVLIGNPDFFFTNPTSGAVYQIIITQDATGGRTVTWPTIYWKDKTVPSLTGTPSSRDIVTLTYDGTNYNAVLTPNLGTP